MQYLFDRWGAFEKSLEDMHLYLFLDYDGTLTPIVETPDKAVLSDETRAILQKLSGNPRCTVAVVSGRSLEDIKKRVGVKTIVYVGNHGLEIDGPKIHFKNPMMKKDRYVLNLIKEKLEKKISPIRGAFIEDKYFSLSLHYRLVDKKKIPELENAFLETVRSHLIRDDIRMRLGKMVLELRLPVDWDKGRTVLWLLARQRFALQKNHAKIFPIYIGDDVTDEDVFVALNKKGATIIVGKQAKSLAEYYIKSPREVQMLLKRILALQKGVEICRN